MGRATILIAVFLAACGCRPTVEELASPVKQYRVTVTTPIGVRHREYVILSKTQPHVSRYETQSLLRALPPDAKRWETINNYPEDWLIEVELIKTPESNQ